MPIRKCQSDNKPGFSWGFGNCYTYDPNNENSKQRALERAKKQGQAIEINKHKSKSDKNPQSIGFWTKLAKDWGLI